MLQMALCLQGVSSLEDGDGIVTNDDQSSLINCKKVEKKRRFMGFKKWEFDLIWSSSSMSLEWNCSFNLKNLLFNYSSSL